MATFILNTTPEQDVLLAWVTKVFNEQRDQNLTVDQFVQTRFLELLAPYAAQYKDYLTKRVAEAFAATDDTTKAQILSKLGVA